MKFKLQSKKFHSAAAAVAKVINSKNALQVLNNFLVTLNSDGLLTITASDVENAVTARLQTIEAEGEGKVCIEARRLVDLLKELPDAPVEVDIDMESYAIKIKCPSANYDMMGINGDEYPEYSRGEEDATEPITLALTAEVLIDGIDRTMFAVSTEEFRPQMMGIYIDIHESDITFVATDTRKLVRYINRNVEPGLKASAILPVKPANILRSIYAKEDELTVTMTNKGMTVTGEAFEFNCRFIKGNYPDYNRVIPQNNPYTLSVDRSLLTSAMRRVGSFVNTAIGLVRFHLGGEELKLDSRDVSMCTNARESLPCAYEGAPMTICFSAPFIIDICSVIPTDDVIIKLSDPGRPGVFLPTDNDEKTDLVLLLMPMSLGEY